MIDIEIMCNQCNSSLDILEVRYSQWGPELIINPCESCMDDAEEKAFEKGREEGESEKG